MFIYVPILLIVLGSLVIKSRKHIQGTQLRKRFNLLLLVGCLSVILCLIFGLAGVFYVQHYQSASNECPQHYPYSWAVAAATLLGFIAFVYTAVIAFRQKQLTAGFMLIGITILFLITAVVMWIGSMLCFTF